MIIRRNHPGEWVFLPVLILITDRNVRAPGMTMENGGPLLYRESCFGKFMERSEFECIKMHEKLIPIFLFVSPCYTEFYTVLLCAILSCLRK